MILMAPQHATIGSKPDWPIMRNIGYGVDDQTNDSENHQARRRPKDGSVVI